MQPTILITRPDPAGAEFADLLRQRLGCKAGIVLSPLMRIEQTGARPDLSGIRQLIFTSRNGVSAFAAGCERRDIPCYCVGDATAEAAREAGMKARAFAGTADDLVKGLVQENPAGTCLHLRGAHAAGHVAERLNAAGIATKEAVLYRQEAQPLTGQARQILTGDKPVILPVFSPRTARLLAAAGPITAPVQVVALSDNVAAALAQRLDLPCFIAQRPDADAMLTAIHNIILAAKPLET